MFLNSRLDSPSVLIKQHPLTWNYKAAAGSICIYKWANIRFQIMFIHPCHLKLVINIFGSCGMGTLSLWISCVWVCWGEGVGGVDMSVQGQYHSRGGKERGRKGEGTGLGTENSLLGWNCIEAPTNHKTLLFSLAPYSLTHQTIYRLDRQPRHLLLYRALCSKIYLNILLIYQIRRAMLAGNLRSINKYKIVAVDLSDFWHCSFK